MKRSTWVRLGTMILLPALAFSQGGLTLRDAVERARRNYPAVAVTRAQVEAASAGIRLARTSYLPRVDTIAQVNRATRNNLYGMLLQQSVISPISGPPVLENSATSVFGSAAGFLVDWEPFDFGTRRARMELADTARQHAEATVARSEFEVGAAAADAFLTVLAARQTVQAARARVERNEVTLRVVESLVRTGLRPGADASAARAELASAQAQVVRAEQAVAEAKALLAGLTGIPIEQTTPAEGGLPRLPPAEEKTADDLARNPIAREQSAVIEEAQARERTLDHLWTPKFSVQGTTYARGTGARPDMTTLGGANGLSPTFFNWGVGFSVKFPLMEYASIRAQQAQEAAKIHGEQSRYRLLLTELDIQRNRAMAAVEAARKLAELAPIQLEAARAAESQAQARYRSGLSTQIEIAEAQRALTQAEIDDGLARLNVWRAMLALRTAEGDLTPLLDAAGH
jgi:outer membrane protein